MTGKAMLLSKDTVFVVGAPLVFPLDDLPGTYAGRSGAILRAVSAADGATLAEYKLSQLPVWDGMAAAYGRLFLVNKDGSAECWGAPDHGLPKASLRPEGARIGDGLGDSRGAETARRQR